jgi:hypothetical protein
MEAFNIPAAQKSTTGSEQCEGDTGCFFDYWDVVHHEYATLDQTANKEYYQEVPSLFIPLDTGFPGQAWHSTGLQGSLLS